jgi:hypothetical protein
MDMATCCSVPFVNSPTVNTYEPASLNFDKDPPPPDPAPDAQITPSQQASTTCCAFIGGIPSDPILNCYYGAILQMLFPNYV